MKKIYSLGFVFVVLFAMIMSTAAQNNDAVVTITEQQKIDKKNDMDIYPLQLIVARGTDNTLWYRVINGMIIEDWKSLGGIVTSDPEVISINPDRVDVFVKGTDNALWQRTGQVSYTGMITWGSWKSLGGIITSGPGTEFRWPDGMRVFARGTDNSVWYKEYDGYSWGDWKHLSGIITSDPDVLSPSPHGLVARGTDNAVWILQYEYWKSLGGISSSGPAITWKHTSVGEYPTAIVFTAGSDNSLWYKEYDLDSQKWLDWTYFGGKTPSSPDATSYGKLVDAEYIDIVVRGTDNALWMRSWRYGTGWQNWYSLEGIITSGPSIATIRT